MNLELELQLERTCRTCSLLSVQPGIFVSLFKPPPDLAVPLSDIVKLANFFKLEIIETDNLPKQICKRCLHHFTEILKFRKRCQAAQIKLKVLFESKELPSKTAMQDEADFEYLADVEMDEEKIFDDFIDEENTEILQENGIKQSLIERVTINGFKGKNVIDDGSKTESETNDSIIESEHDGSISESEADGDITESEVDGEITDYDSDFLAVEYLEDDVENQETKINTQQHPSTDSAQNEILLTDLEEHSQKCPKTDENCKNAPISNIIGESFEDFENHIPKFEINEHVCNICYRKFTEVESLKEHLTAHINNGIFKCEPCGLEFPNLYRLNAHTKRKHIPFEKQCPTCQKIFKNQFRYDYHIRFHKTEKNNKSEYCERMFMEKPPLESHNPVLTCSHCGKEFRHSADLELHQQTHIDENQAYLCTECNKNFSVHETYVLHLRTHTEASTSFECSSRTELFNAKSSLNHHQFSKHGSNSAMENTTFKNKCSICPLSFKDSKSLESHVKSSHNDRPYVCDICQSRFNRKRHLKIHKQIVHLKSKPFQCKKCNRYFTRESERRKHMKKHKAYITLNHATEKINGLRERVIDKTNGPIC